MDSQSLSSSWLSSDCLFADGVFLSLPITSSFGISPSCALPEAPSSLLLHWGHATLPSITSVTLSATACSLYVSLLSYYTPWEVTQISTEILMPVILGWHFQEFLNEAHEYYEIFIKALLIHLNSQCENMSPYLVLHHVSVQQLLH